MSNENYFSVKLPSKCLIYPEVDKNNSDAIQIRTLKGRDEKLLAEITASSFDKKFNIILKNVLKGVDSLKLTLGDRLFLILWETINSYSKEYVLEHECGNCWQKSEYTIDLSKDIESVVLPDNYKEPYSIKLPESEDVVKLRLIRVEDIIKVDEMSKTGENIWLYRYALTMVDENKNIWDRINYLESMGVKDLAVIRAFHDKFEHGPVMKTKYECLKCGGTGEMPVPFQLGMLIPYGEKLKRYIENAV
jgi:hypothetical protein